MSDIPESEDFTHSDEEIVEDIKTLDRMAHIPQAGDVLTLPDCENIVEAIVTRQQKFPGEPVGLTIALILMNIGDRYSPVECIEQEWTALKKDLERGEGDPKCPNGHELTIGPGLKLGWIPDI